MWLGGHQPRTVSSGRRTDREYHRTLKIRECWEDTALTGDIEINITGDWRLQLNHRLLGPEQRRSLIDDLQGSVLVQSSLQDEMLLQNLRLRLAGSGVKYFGHRELVGGGEWDAWKAVLQNTVIQSKIF